MIKILIVDDEKAIVKSTLLYLKTKGYTNVNFLTDSRLVVDYIQSNQPNIILLDLNMPHVSGKTILESVKKLNLKVKIIIISAIDDNNILDECIKLGAQDFLVKPLNHLSLVSCIQKLDHK